MQVIVSNEIIDSTKYIAREIVKRLSTKYHFDTNEAINFLEINIPEREITKTEVLNTEKNNIPLPFTGHINPNCCHGIRFNYGLYTQCTNTPCLFNTEYPICQTCNKQVEKNSNNKPNYGYIEERIEQGSKYRDPKGKSPLHYANVMEKMNITRHEAERAAKKVGQVIPEDEFTIKKVTRGRPKKDTSAEDTASESSFTEVKSEKKRGRPKKNKDVVNVNSVDNMFKEMTTELTNLDDKPEAAKEAAVEKEADEEDEEKEDEDNDSEQAEALPIKLNKKTELGYVIVENESLADYLLTNNNELYEPFTHDRKGMWNAITKKLEEVDSDDE